VEELDVFLPPKDVAKSQISLSKDPDDDGDLSIGFYIMAGIGMSYIWGHTVVRLKNARKAYFGTYKMNPRIGQYERWALTGVAFRQRRGIRRTIIRGSVMAIWWATLGFFGDLGNPEKILQKFTIWGFTVGYFFGLRSGRPLLSGCYYGIGSFGGAAILRRIKGDL